jgi:RNA polymerase sigma factor (sigma-70 family)
MNVHIAFKAAKAPEIEKEFQQQIEKLRRRLAVFRPDLVHLKAIVEENNPREGTCVSLNLRLPSGQMAAQKSNHTPLSAIKAAFADLLSQLTRHKEQLRGHKRPPARRAARDEFRDVVPFEQTFAAVHPPKISDADISTWIDANLGRLRAFVEREIAYREANGMLEDGAVIPEEVINQAIADALSDEEKPELLTLERWLYRLALRSIHRVVANDNEAVSAVPLELSARKQNVRGSDEPELQFHQPDEMLHRADVIPDLRTSNPEQAASSVEMVNLVESSLRGAPREDREAFILFAVEGFTLDEIAATTDRKVDQVRSSIAHARELVRQKMPPSSLWREKLLQHTKIA